MTILCPPAAATSRARFTFCLHKIVSRIDKRNKTKVEESRVRRMTKSSKTGEKGGRFLVPSRVLVIGTRNDRVL